MGKIILRMLNVYIEKVCTRAAVPNLFVQTYPEAKKCNPRTPNVFLKHASWKKI